MWALTPYDLLRCYAVGHFPMANDRDNPGIFLVNPEHRGIIPLDRFHVPRRLKRTMRSLPYTVRVDSAFLDVIMACAEETDNRPRTWLNDELIELYKSLFELGHAHSVELWRDERLVGGLYGVSLGAAFFGESMFSRERDTSKMALVELVGRLRAGGYELLDTQFVTEHLRRFGALEVPRHRYRELLRRALKRPAVFPTSRGWFADSVLGRYSPNPEELSRPSTSSASGAEPCSGASPADDSTAGTSQRRTQTS